MFLKGWTQMDVPSGWIQILRGPRPPSQKWPKSSSASKRAASPGAHGAGGEVFSQAARLKVVKLEKSLEVMGDSEDPAVECLNVELDKAWNGEKRRPINVQVEECRKFIIWSEKHISELDAEVESEVVALDEAKERLLRLEAEQAAVPFEDPANIPIPLVWQAQMDALKAQLVSLEKERDRVRAASCKRHAVGHGQTHGVILPMP